MKVFGLLLLLASGCTYDRIATDASKFLDRSELGHGYHISSAQRWRLSPDRPLAITTINPADRQNRQRLITAAIGLEHSIPQVSLFDNASLLPEQADMVLVIGWPDQKPIEPELRNGWQLRLLPLEKMLPNLARNQAIKLWLFDANNQLLISHFELEVDPAFWTPAKFDLDLLEHAFANLGAHLTAT